MKRDYVIEEIVQIRKLQPVFSKEHRAIYEETQAKDKV